MMGARGWGGHGELGFNKDRAPDWEDEKVL